MSIFFLVQGKFPGHENTEEDFVIAFSLSIDRRSAGTSPFSWSRIYFKPMAIAESDFLSENIALIQQFSFFIIGGVTNGPTKHVQKSWSL